MTHANTPCPCGSGNPLAKCCSPFIANKSFPSTPEQLMRSRFSAFFLGEAQYLLSSTHTSARSPQSLEDIQNTIATTKWHSLLVISSKIDENDYGVVEFVAFFSSKGSIDKPHPTTKAQNIEQLHEHSTFARENGRWRYLTGEHIAPYTLGRNNPCWCGSGVKFKKCHSTFNRT